MKPLSMESPIPAAPSDVAEERRDRWMPVKSPVPKLGTESELASILVGDGCEGSRGAFEAGESEDRDLACTRPRELDGGVEPEINE
jgi:hypothetical protein